MGLLKPVSGQIEIFGKARRSETDFLEVRSRIGLLFQDPEDQLFCPTVAEDLAFGPFNLGWNRSEVESAVKETLGLLGLAGYEERITYRLSGGEKRLVSLATILVMKPEILLLDEPVSGLDEEATQRVITVLNNLPVDIIAISHDHEFLEEITEKAIILKDGCFKPFNIKSCNLSSGK